jgi:predicted GTPase/uncharacterized tellurite resistance protein B-like protein
MDTSLIQIEAVELLSRLTGQKLAKKSLTPPVLFMTAVLFVIIGVMHVDGEVSSEEKDRFKAIINSLVSKTHKFRQFVQIINKNIIENKLYRNVDNLLLLTTGFSEEEKLLLICLGYQISMADNFMDIKEKKYLEIVAKNLQIDLNYLKTLEAVFTEQDIIDLKGLNQVRYLLDPVRFHNLDQIFIKAASQCLQSFPSKHHHDQQHHLQRDYSVFESFKQQHQQLESNCNYLLEIIEEGCNRNIISEYLLEQVQETLQKIQSQRFRIAVIGEFSQGKSTLLNAWLGEEIQPVRANPCTGAITVLKYGTKKRVICLYKDGSEAEIPLEQYQEKTTISEEAAIESLTEELAHSEIREIILEHPGLILCKNGIEIVDSPGLNEHPNRTAITQQLIQDTDAIIFLTNSLRLLTQGERELLQDLRLQVNNGNKNEPATNIFIVVNFMDLLRKEQDRQDVQQRVEKFIFGQEPIITGNNRIHFVSAQAALDAILDNVENDYLKSFQLFTQSVEQFLINECGKIKINQAQQLINNLISSCSSEIEQFDKLVTGKLQLSEQNKQQIFDCIGEATGRYVKMRLLINPLLEETMENVFQSWNNWVENLVERLKLKSQNWTSSEDDKEKMMRDYARKFARDFEQDFQDNFESKIMSEYLQEYIELLDEETNAHIEAITNNLESLDLEIGSNLVNQFSLSIANIKQDINLNLFVSKEDSESGAGWLGFGGGALVAGLLSIFTGGLWIPIALGGAAMGLLGWFFDDDPKQKVLEKGFEKFGESADNIYDQVCDKIISIFRDRFGTFKEIITQAIAICEQLIEQNELAHQKSLQSSEISLKWINQKRQELKKICNNIKSN